MIIITIVAAFVGMIGAVLFWGNPYYLSRWTRLLSAINLKVVGLRISIEGEEYLTSAQPCIYLLNHQSGLDLFTFGSHAAPKFTVIAKKEVRYIPVIGLLFMATGVIFINRRNKDKAIESLDEAARVIGEKKVSVAVAPEGTRNFSGEGLLPFKKGPFHLAIQAQVPLVPYLCSSLHTLGSFKERRLSSGLIRLKVLPPIPTKGLTIDDIDALMSQTYAVMLRAVQGLKSEKD